MIWPTEADILVSAVDMRKMADAGALCAICFVVVFTPFILSWRRLRRHPGKWRGRGYLIVTGVILTLNVISVLFWFFDYKPQK
jgi:drug/metabolite transporter (DMT)-like permease